MTIQIKDLSAYNESNSLKRLDVALALRSLEIGIFWQRTLFFWGFISLAFAAYATLQKNQHLLLVISGFGMVCSLVWTLLNRGSKYWKECWDQKVKNEEKGAIGLLFGKEEDRLHGGVWAAQRFSVTKLAIAVSDYIFLVWVALFLTQAYQACRALVVTKPLPAFIKSELIYAGSWAQS